MATSRTQVACALLLLCGGVALQAQPTRGPRAMEDRDREVVTAAMARALEDSLFPMLAAAQRDSAFPGGYVVVGDSRGILYERAVGRLDWGPSPRPTRETLWDLASLTKVLALTTVTAVLVERGQIELDAPVQRYLPQWTGPRKERVTIRHLITHTSGLPAFRAYDRQTQNPDSLAMLLRATELEGAPGDRMVYSDIGAFVLGEVLERVGGSRLDRLADSLVFGPLRMFETMFIPPRHLRHRIAPTEVDTTRGGLVHGQVHDERAYYLGGVAAHAGLFGTAADLSRFALMLLRDGTLDGVRILDSGTVAAFTRYVDSTVSNRALGWQKPERDGMRFRTPSSSWAGTMMSGAAFGHTGFTGTSIAVDPELDLFVILLTNRVNPRRDNPNRPGIVDVRREVADAIVSIVVHQRSQTSTSEPQ